MFDDGRAEEEARELASPAGDSSEVILLVEDDEAVRELNAAMLRDLDYDLIEAESGAVSRRNCTCAV